MDFPNDPQTMNRRELGEWGERLAAQYLQGKGYQIVEKNYSCKLGEIDLIVTDQDYLVIVEVKTRSTKNFGPPQTAVDWRKQVKLRRMAAYYLLKMGLADRKVRFDVIGIFTGDKGEILHLEAAF